MNTLCSSNQTCVCVCMLVFAFPCTHACLYACLLKTRNLGCLQACLLKTRNLGFRERNCAQSALLSSVWGLRGRLGTSVHPDSPFHRNEALGNVDALQAELKYLIKQREAGKEESTSDLLQYLADARKSLDLYLSGLNQEDVNLAKNYVAKGTRLPK